MKAITFNHSGDAQQVLTLTEHPIPTIQADQILIKVDLATIQPADFLFISGKYRVKPVFPQVAGVEGYGEVIAVGSLVTKRLVGDFVSFRSTGVWAEYAVTTEFRTYSVPANIRPTVAAQFSLNPLTAWGLLDVSIKHENSNILFTASDSVVAKLTAHIAIKQGHSAFGLTRVDDGYSLTDFKNHKILAHASSIAECLAQSAELFDVIIDAVGGKDTPVLIQNAKQNCVIVSYGILDNSSFTLPTSTILFKNLTWLGFGIDAWLNQVSPTKLGEIEKTLWSYLSESPELMPVSNVFPISSFGDAIQNAVTKKDGKTLISLA